MSQNHDRDAVPTYDRKHVVDLLRRTGYGQAAEEAARLLPDPVHVEDARTFCRQHQIHLDDLVSRMGGSP